MKKLYDFQQGEILLVNKPLKWTSFDVVKKIRHPLSQAFKVKRFKVGHAGTLDPLATGLLVVCTGKKTKEIEQLLTADKTYTGIIQLGATTPSYDLETSIDQHFETQHINAELIANIKQNFIGQISQTPPVFSAKRINGQRAYDVARKGKEVEMKPSLIEIKELELKLIGTEIHFEICCTKGTYIRSLAYDIGKALNSGAHLTRLERTASGQFNLSDAKNVEDWIQIIREQIPEHNN